MSIDMLSQMRDKWVMGVEITGLFGILPITRKCDERVSDFLL